MTFEFRQEMRREMTIINSKLDYLIKAIDEEIEEPEEYEEETKEIKGKSTKIKEIEE